MNENNLNKISLIGWSWVSVFFIVNIVIQVMAKSGFDLSVMKYSFIVLNLVIIAVFYPLYRIEANKLKCNATLLDLFSVFKVLVLSLVSLVEPYYVFNHDNKEQMVYIKKNIEMASIINYNIRTNNSNNGVEITKCSDAESLLEIKINEIYTIKQVSNDNKYISCEIVDGNGLRESFKMPLIK